MHEWCCTNYGLCACQSWRFLFLDCHSDEGNAITGGLGVPLWSAPPMDVYALAHMQGRCEGPPPGNFNLTEPLPPGACALRVREDFLDAPSGTTCLLIDSLYVLVAPRGEVMTSSVLILHVRPPAPPRPCICCSMHTPHV